jgi:hypothetical protein
MCTKQLLLRTRTQQNLGAPLASPKGYPPLLCYLTYCTTSNIARKCDLAGAKSKAANAHTGTATSGCLDCAKCSRLPMPLRKSSWIAISSPSCTTRSSENTAPPSPNDSARASALPSWLMLMVPADGPGPPGFPRSPQANEWQTCWPPVLPGIRLCCCPFCHQPVVSIEHCKAEKGSAGTGPGGSGGRAREHRGRQAIQTGRWHQAAKGLIMQGQ